MTTRPLDWRSSLHLMSPRQISLSDFALSVARRHVSEASTSAHSGCAGGVGQTKQTTRCGSDGRALEQEGQDGTGADERTCGLDLDGAATVATVCAARRTRLSARSRCGAQG